VIFSVDFFTLVADAHYHEKLIKYATCFWFNQSSPKQHLQSKSRKCTLQWLQAFLHWPHAEPASVSIVINR